MHDTRHNQHQLIKSGNPSDKISNKIQRIKKDSKPIVPNVEELIITPEIQGLQVLVPMTVPVYNSGIGCFLLNQI